MSAKKATVKNAPGRHYPASWVIGKCGLPSLAAYSAALAIVEEAYIKQHGHLPLVATEGNQAEGDQHER